MRASLSIFPVRDLRSATCPPQPWRRRTRNARFVPACLLLSAALATSGCELMVAGPREQASDVWEKTYAVSPTVALEVENTNGSVTVRPHDNPTIEVKATRTAKAVTAQGAKDLLARLNLEEVATADRVRLATPRVPGLSMGQQVEVRYEVLVPPTAQVTLKTVNGHVDVERLSGRAALETVNGAIIGRELSGVRRAETVNGSVELALTAVAADGLSVETVNGGVEISLPSSAQADVSVRTVNGGIDVRGFAAIGDGERRRRRFEGKVNGGGANLRVETVNGGVSVTGRGPKATAPAPTADGR